MASLLCWHPGFSRVRSSIPPAPPPVNHDFDFWLGEWKMTNPDGRPAGMIELSPWRMVAGCSKTGRARRRTAGAMGKSLNAYNLGKKQWQQFWIGGGGGVSNSQADSSMAEWYWPAHVRRQPDSDGSRGRQMQVAPCASCGSNPPMVARRGRWSSTASTQKVADDVKEAGSCAIGLLVVRCVCGSRKRCALRTARWPQCRRR